MKSAWLALTLAMTSVVGVVVADDLTLTIKARVQTEPVNITGDAADDPAIWLHPTDPAKSLILGTNKKDGLNVYDLDGKLLQTVSPGARPNNVDVIYAFPLEGRKADLAVAGCRSPQTLGVKVWRIDPETRELSDITVDGSVIPVVAGQQPYGSCVYHSPRDGKFYFFINDKTGRVEQYEMFAGASGHVGGRLVRTLKLSSEVEGCVADDEKGIVYVAEESTGICRFDAEPAGRADGRLVARVGDHGLTADVEGLTIYCASDGKGYLLASSQGSSTYNIYDRDGDNAFVQTIATSDGDSIDRTEETDGIAVLNRPLGEKCPKGLFVVQDGKTPSGKQNFKLFGWEDIAGNKLLIDPSWSPRSVTPRTADVSGR